MKKILYLSPEGFDYSSNQLTEGLQLILDSGGISSFKCTNKVVHHGSKTSLVETVSEDQASQMLDESDIIIISSGGDLSFKEGLRGEVTTSGKYTDKLVFLDGHDSNALLLPPESVKLYLKRELRYPEANHYVVKNIRSFTFGVYDFHFDEVRPMYDDRDIDVSFVAFGGSSPLRKECAMALKSASDAGIFKKVFIAVEPDKQPLTIEQYRRVMTRSKVIISVPGAGLDTLRFWEAMGFGAVLSSIDITKLLYIRNSPEPIRQAMFGSGWESLIGLTKMVVDDKDRWTMMRKSTDWLIRMHHSTNARARQMIEMFDELRNG